MTQTNFATVLRQETAQWDAIPPRAPGKDMLEDNGKAGLAVGCAFCTCNPTAACARECYAARRALRWATILRKAIAVTKAIMADPIEAAARMVAEFERRAPKRGAKFLRWNSSGDLFTQAVVCIERIARAGIIVHVFTRKPALGKALRDYALANGLPIVVLCSVDPGNVDAVLAAAPDGRYAALTSATHPAPFSQLPAERTVAFPVNARPVNIATVPETFKAGACPCDMAVRHFSDSCARCLEDGTGCFMSL
jgi:hypothetical protein